MIVIVLANILITSITLAINDLAVDRPLLVVDLNLDLAVVAEDNSPLSHMTILVRSIAIIHEIHVIHLLRLLLRLPLLVLLTLPLSLLVANRSSSTYRRLPRERAFRTPSRHLNHSIGSFILSSLTLIR